MAVKFSESLRNDRAEQIKAKIDADTNPGILQFYTGPQPDTGAAITTQTLLGTLTFSKPCGTVTGGVLTFGTVAEDSAADATGEAAWGRISDGAGNFVMDGDVGDLNSTAAFRMITPMIIIDTPIKIEQVIFPFSITEGNA